MKQANGKSSVGRILTAIAAVAALASLILYHGVLNRTKVPYVAVAVSLVVFVLLTLVSRRTDSMLPARAIAFLNAALLAAALITGIGPMVNQMGFVVAGLDTVSTISSLIAFAACSAAAMLLNIIASFLI